MRMSPRDWFAMLFYVYALAAAASASVASAKPTIHSAVPSAGLPVTQQSAGVSDAASSIIGDAADSVSDAASVSDATSISDAASSVIDAAADSVIDAAADSVSDAAADSVSDAAVSDSGPASSSHPITPARIILTTRGITDDVLPSLLQLLDEVAQGERPTIAVVITAAMAPCSTDADCRKREQVVESSHELSTRVGGASIELIDCAHDDPATMEEVVGRSHAVYVVGGNTFYLLHHLRRSGLDVVVQRRILQQGAIYVGCSAGSIVAGRSIRTAFWKGWDDPRVVEAVDWGSEQAQTALGLVSVSLFPHYEPAAHEALVQQRRGELDHGLVTLDEAGGAYMVGVGTTVGVY